MGATRWLISTLLVCALVGQVRAAEPVDEGGSGGDVLGPMVGMAVIGLTIGGGVFGVANLVHLPRDYRNHGVWRVGGFITGSVNMTMAALLLYGYYQQPASERHDFSLKMTWAQLAVGVVSTGAAIWNSTKPPWQEDAGVAVSPVVMSDSRGGPAIGLAVSVVGW